MCHRVTRLAGARIPVTRHGCLRQALNRKHWGDLAAERGLSIVFKILLRLTGVVTTTLLLLLMMMLMMMTWQHRGVLQGIMVPIIVRFTMR